MDESYQKIKEAIAYYVEKADLLVLPEECSMAEDIADKIFFLEETLTILKELHDDA